MDDKDWGLTAKGFKCPTYVELLNAYEYKARELFGTKANLTVRMDYIAAFSTYGRCLQ